MEIITFVLSVLAGVVLVFLCIVLAQVMFILRDVSKVATLTRKTVRQVSEVLIQPAQIFSHILKHVSSFAGDIPIASLLGVNKKKRKK